MQHEHDPSHYHWLLAAGVCLMVSMGLASALVYWGVKHDLGQVRMTLIESEMNRLRTHAMRTATRIQDELRNESDPTDLDQIRKYSWLGEHWRRSVLADESRQCAAVADVAGRIVLHSDLNKVGQTLEPVWYDAVVPDGGDDVVDTKSSVLTSGERALVVQLPLIVEGTTRGTYFSGLSHQWLERELMTRRSNILRTWMWIAVGMVILLVLSAICLLQIGRRITAFREAIALQRVRRFTELGHLVAGLAHEIRNPLNAIMLNNHVVGRFLQKLTRDGEYREIAGEQSIIMKETTQEIERVESMLRILLGYARPTQPHYEEMNVCQEVKATLIFLKELFDRSDVLVRARLPESKVNVQFDRDRFRQILHNLLSNAQEAVGNGGTIEIDVRGGRDTVELVVADDGPGVPMADRERVFEPFYSTKEKGTGLGLALVRRYIEEVGGSVVCESNEPRGARFVLVVPLRPRTRRAVARGEYAPV